MTDSALERSGPGQSFFIDVSIACVSQSLAVGKVASAIMDRAEVALALAELPEEMALRAMLDPHLFEAQA